MIKCPISDYCSCSDVDTSNESTKNGLTRLLWCSDVKLDPMLVSLLRGKHHPLVDDVWSCVLFRTLSAEWFLRQNVCQWNSWIFLKTSETKHNHTRVVKLWNPLFLNISNETALHSRLKRPYYKSSTDIYLEKQDNDTCYWGTIVWGKTDPCWRRWRDGGSARLSCHPGANLCGVHIILNTTLPDL